MGRLTRALLGGERRSVDTFQSVFNTLGYLGYESFGWRQPSSGEAITSDTALATGAVYACIRVLSDNIGALPLLNYDAGPDDQRARSAPNHPTVRLLREPLPGVTQSQWLATMVAHLNGWGDAFIGKPRNSQGDVYALPLIRPERVTVKLLDNYEPQYVVDGRYGTTYSRADILHIPALSTDGVRGLSPINQARDTVGTNMALQRDAGRAAGNRFVPEVVLKSDGRLTTGAAQDLKARFKQALSDPGAIPVLEEGLNLQAVTINPRDAQFIEQRKYSATEVARIFRVPPYMIAADGPSSMTYSNVEQEALHFLMYSVNPWLVAIEQALSLDQDLYVQDGRMFPEFQRAALLQTDTLTRYHAYQIALGGAPFMTPNQPRRLENWPPLEGGDVLPVEKPGPTKFAPEPAAPVPATGVPKPAAPKVPAPPKPAGGK